MKFGTYSNMIGDVIYNIVEVMAGVYNLKGILRDRHFIATNSLRAVTTVTKQMWQVEYKIKFIFFIEQPNFIFNWINIYLLCEVILQTVH